MPGPAGVVKNTPNLTCQTKTGTATAATLVAAGTKVALCGIALSSAVAGTYIDVHKGGDAATIYASPTVGVAGMTYLSFPHPILCDGLGVTQSAACRWTVVYAEV